MFDSEIYAYLKKSYYFKRFWIYCFIGAGAVFVIGATIIFLASIKTEGYRLVAADCAGAAFMLLPIAFITKLRIKPSICTVGKIVSKRGTQALIQIGDKKIRATSFEHFLRNKSLKEYSVGEEVLIYCLSNILITPLFYSSRIFELEEEEEEAEN